MILLYETTVTKSTHYDVQHVTQHAAAIAYKVAHFTHDGNVSVHVVKGLAVCGMKAYAVDRASMFGWCVVV